MFTNYIYLIYMYKAYLALNNQQWFTCHKTKPNQIIISILENVENSDKKKRLE